MKFCRRLGHLVGLRSHVRSGRVCARYILGLGLVLAVDFSWLGLSALPASSQTPSPVLSFEVAAVKRAAPDHIVRSGAFFSASVEEQMRFFGGPGSKSPDRIIYSGVTLKMLLKKAHAVKNDQISGPGWLDTERYDITAKLPAGTSAAQLPLMLQGLLTERFQIRLHRETKKLTVYLLTVAKGGPKLEPPEKLPDYKDDDEKQTAVRSGASDALNALRATRATSGDRTPRRTLHLANATAEKFAEVLSSNLDLPVKDRTQLGGFYAFTLKWVPDGSESTADPQSGPSIFAAVEEQLGLKLHRAKEEFEVLVVDNAEKIPGSN
jgi:uncharacterized protein (TIGR03435 family)